MSNTTDASGPLTQEQLDALRSGCQSLIDGIDTSYGYVPSLGAGITFCVLFGLSLFGHFVQFIRKRQWTSFAFGVGALTEVIGWAGRTWSSECPYNNDAFLMQITTLIIAPTFITAGLYVILGALITRLGRESSILGPRMYALVFLTCDIIALIVQAVGGAMASTESDKIDGDTKPGTNIMVAGILFQMAAMVVFALLVLDFLRRVFVKKSYLQTRQKGLSDGSALPKAYTWLLAAIFVSLTMIFIRSIYRTVELLQGWSGYLITHEGYFIGLDGAIMVVAIAVFNFLDPVYLLWGQDNKLASVLEQNELRGTGEIWSSYYPRHAIAAQHSSSKIINIISDIGASKMATNQITAMHLAASRGSHETAQEILKLVHRDCPIQTAREKVSLIMQHNVWEETPLSASILGRHKAVSDFFWEEIKILGTVAKYLSTDRTQAIKILEAVAQFEKP
ncbi:RSB1-integral membrane transporter [Fusarium sp. NRRL 52700]|nr:RSB1-integral membrane transporter [Fusarium sp. NRRL 52700]